MFEAAGQGHRNLEKINRTYFLILRVPPVLTYTVIAST